MIILGINAFGHNPSACLIQEGILLSFCQEERLTRLKGSFGFFPSKAIDWCLRSNGISLQHVDKIAYSWDCTKYPGKMMVNLAKIKIRLLGKSPYIEPSSINQKGNVWSAFEYLQFYTPNSIKEKIRDHLRTAGHMGPIPKIVFVEHHVAHAYQTYYQSPFQDSIILIVDGSGEENCVSGFFIKNGKMRKLFGFDIPQSLGWFYGGFTAYLGFCADRDEGKLMGLAAMGESRKLNNPWIERLDAVLKITEDGFKMNPLFFKFGGNEYHPRYTDHLVKYITSFNPELEPVNFDEKIKFNGSLINKYLLCEYVDLAYAVQTKLEQTMNTLVNRLVKETGIKNLCLAGGVSLNCKVNGFILENSQIENIFVHPASSDDGSSIGAGFFVSEAEGENPRNTLEHVQYGPRFNSDEVEKILKNCNISYSKPEDVCQEAAKLLSQDRIIAWFQGGAEMGARALGGRSIIASPVNPGIKERINRNVKFRETWRPYCPSINSEYKNKYFQNASETPFMTIAMNATNELSKQASGVVHVDGTTRPQTVKKDILPKWHYLIECTKSFNGHPVILNTSFNIRGEPMVCSPYDAIRCLFSTGLDAMVIEDFIVAKKKI